jgi:hypothetical protein
MENEMPELKKLPNSARLVVDMKKEILLLAC